MKLLLSVLSSLIISISGTAQQPGAAYNPMTANGARHIHRGNDQYFSHKLFWENPPGFDYNEVYFSLDSNLVISLDSSSLFASGYGSLAVLDSVSLEPAGYLEAHAKYYWRVVEYDSAGSVPGPLWYFTSQGYDASWWFDDFHYYSLSDYTLIEPAGAFWAISNTNHAGLQVPELELYNFGINGTAYLILNDYFDLSPNINPFHFYYSVEWGYGQFTIGVAYSLDEGTTWIPFWQQVITGNIPADQINIPAPNENYVKLALFCTDNGQPSSGVWYVDNLTLDSWLTVSLPPKQIRTVSDTASLKVSLNWDPGYTVNPSWGYRIQRKNGLPFSPSDYSTIAEVDPSTLSYNDYNVQLDSVYTYRIEEKEGPNGSWRTAWSNEATTYVPSYVPVELTDFSVLVTGHNVVLNWTTSTETNNLGFDVERSQSLQAEGQYEWNKIAFIQGHGTTTKIHSYSYTDNDAAQVKYSYRLKQIDMDGSFKYSKIVNVTIVTPKEFSLSQNYPNPFNPATRIEYSIPDVGTSPAYRSGRFMKFAISLKVYDILGNEIATLVNEEKPAGTYEINWNAADLPSGIYFYQLRAGSYVQTEKMILLK